MLKRRIAAFGAAIMAAICILVTQAVIKERNAAFDRVRSEAANLAAGFEEGVRGILNGVTGASEFLKDHIEEQEAKGEAFNLAVWKSKIPGSTQCRLQKTYILLATVHVSLVRAALRCGSRIRKLENGEVRDLEALHHANRRIE